MSSSFRHFCKNPWKKKILANVLFFWNQDSYLCGYKISALHVVVRFLCLNVWKTSLLKSWSELFIGHYETDFNWWRAVELHVRWNLLQGSLSLTHLPCYTIARELHLPYGFHDVFFLNVPCPQPSNVSLDLINALRLASLGIFLSLHWHLNFSLQTFWRS